MEEKKNSLVPELRFPGFNGEWEVVKLGDISTKVKSRNSALAVSRTLTNSATLGVIDQGDYFDREIAVKENTGNYFIIENDDFVYNPRISSSAPVGPISRNKIGKGIMSPLYTIFRFNGGNIDFFEHYFETTLWHGYLKSVANSGVRHDRMAITVDAFFNMPLFIPSDSVEQQKIADCLSSLDDSIKAEEDQLQALKDHKKGLMQKLFPKEGETAPEFRFPGFSGEWEYKSGNLLFESISNKKHNSDLSILALTQDQGAVPRELINYNVQVSEKSIEGYKVVEIDDFIISLRSFQGGIEYSKYKGLCSPAYIVLRKKNNDICSDFYRYYFKTYNYIQKLNSKLEGIRDGKMISYKQFSEIDLPFPSLPEQQKIADSLSSIDTEIAAQQEKVDALKEHKKGLMQQLFPRQK